MRVTNAAAMNVDWDGNGSIATSDVMVDVNGSGSLDTLTGHSLEWSHLIYDGGDVGADVTTPNASNIGEVDEISFEEYQKMIAHSRVLE
jgi:hypothetical protein